MLGKERAFVLAPSFFICWQKLLLQCTKSRIVFEVTAAKRLKRPWKTAKKAKQSCKDRCWQVS